MHGEARLIPNGDTLATVASVIAGFGSAMLALAHYRLWFGRKRKGERKNREPAERWLVISTAIISLVLFVGLLI
jgi:hypothetical protein